MAASVPPKRSTTRSGLEGEGEQSEGWIWPRRDCTTWNGIRQLQDIAKSSYTFALFGKSKSYLNEVGDRRQVPAVSRALQHAERPGRAEDELALPLGVVAGGGGAEGEVLGLEAAALVLRGQPCSRLRKLNV